MNVTNIKSYVIYNCLSLRQTVINWCNYVIMNTLGFKELKVVTIHNKYFIIPRFFVYLLITRLIGILSRMKHSIDIDADKIHMIKMNNESHNAVILSNNLTFDDIILNIGIQDGNIMNRRMFIKFMLVNQYDSVCLKSLLSKYKDVNNKYDNTVKNILEFNDIKYDDNSKLHIEYYGNRKLIVHDLDLVNVLNNHINYFINMN